MVLTRRTIVGVLAVLLTAIALAGCQGTDEFYDQVKVSRDTAYQEWKGRKEQEQLASPRISGQLSLDDCIKLALAHNKFLQRTLEEKEFARGGQIASYMAILPMVTVTGDYQRLDEVSSMSIPGGPKLTMGDLNNYTAGLSVTQPVFAGGSIIANIQSARLFSLLTDQTIRAAVQDLVYSAAHAYYDVLLNQHLLEISADAVRSSQAHLENVKQNRQGGVASDFDLLRAEVELSNFQAEFIRNKNAINLAKASLIKTMGVSQDSEFELSDKLIYVSGKPTMEQAVAIAYRNRPDLFGKELDIKYQQELLRIAKSLYWPTISAYYQRTYSKPDPHNRMLIDWGDAWQAGINASLPVFDGLAREGGIIQQKARLKQANIDLVDAEETAVFELTKAILSIDNAEEFVQSQQLNLTRANEGLRLAELGYKEGTNTQVETIDAQAALTTARVNYYEAIYSHIIARIDLHKAMGILTKFEPIKASGDAQSSRSTTGYETQVVSSAN
jgi:outer membrane protein TolC